MRQLQNYLFQKSHGHFENIIATLQRLFAEMYLAAEASLQYQSISKRDEISYSNILEISTWDNLAKYTNLAINDPELFGLIQSFIDSAHKLEMKRVDDVYLRDLLKASKKLENFLNSQLR